MKQSMLSSRLRNDLIGVALIVVGVILLIAITMPGDAIVTNWLDTALHTAFGIGAVILPLFIALFGVCFFFLGKHEIVLPRVAIGMVLIYIALITLMGVNAPGAAETPDSLFGPAYIQACGGYLGNGIAFALLNLVGNVIAWVLMLAVIIAGLILIGFSISGFFERLFSPREKREKEPAFTAPYSRARALQEQDGMMAADVEGFVPAAQALDGRGSSSSRTKLLKKRGAAAETQALSGATVALDPDDDVLKGRSKKPSSAGMTRRLDGADELVDDEMARDGSVADAAAGNGKGRRAAKPEEAPQAPALLADSKRAEAPEGGYLLPDPKMLRKSVVKARGGISERDLADMAAKLQDTLHEFSVDADVVGWVHGPTVTLFKVALASGVKVSKISNLATDIGRVFAVSSVRIFSPITGTSLVGIEIPNETRDNVLLGDVLPPSRNDPLLVAIGKDVEGSPITADLEKMPHLLIGGTTGSGKSVAINSFIMSVLMRATPDEVRMILIDPKRVELSLYNDIPHLYVPVVTDPHKAASVLAWAVAEMERRLRLFEEYGARNLAQYNRKADEWAIEHERKLAELAASGADVDAALLDSDDDDEMERLPRIMIVIDELADLMMVAGKEVETSISRIAQLARAAGLHMIIATQRPSTNVITGLIKANITNRIAFNVASGIDSRVILDTVGAEHLVGLGDLLFSTPKLGKPLRIQGCFVDEGEVNAVCKFLRKQGKPDYHEDIFATAVPVLDGGSGGGGSFFGDAGSDDALLWEAAEIVVSSNLGSTSALQRRLKVGYARAGRIMDMLEEKGIVGPANGSKPRDVLVDEMELENIKALVQSDAL